MSDSQHESEPASKRTSKRTSEQCSHEHTQPLPYHFAQLQGLTAQQQAEYLEALDNPTLKGEL